MYLQGFNTFLTELSVFSVVGVVIVEALVWIVIQFYTVLDQWNHHSSRQNYT